MRYKYSKHPGFLFFSAADEKYQHFISPVYLQETRTTVAGGEWVSENLLKLCRILSSAAFLLVAVM